MAAFSNGRQGRRVPRRSRQTNTLGFTRWESTSTRSRSQGQLDEGEQGGEVVGLQQQLRPTRAPLEHAGLLFGFRRPTNSRHRKASPK
jgi:hypothetical protein